MFDYSIQTVVLSSLCRVFPEVDPCREEKTDFSCMKNEPLSFQVAYRLLSGTSMAFHLRIISDLPITLYSEGAVPVSQTEDRQQEDRYRPGVFYDMLFRHLAQMPQFW